MTKYDAQISVDRAAGARRIVSAQRRLIQRLKSAGEPTLHAEQTLLTFVSALQHLEDHKRRIVEHRPARKRKIVDPKLTLEPDNLILPLDYCDTLDRAALAPQVGTLPERYRPSDASLSVGPTGMF